MLPFTLSTFGIHEDNKEIIIKRNLEWVHQSSVTSISQYGKIISNADCRMQKTHKRSDFDSSLLTIIVIDY